MQAQASGLQVSVHGHPNADTLLLWHPAAGAAGPEGDAVSALASRIATRSRHRVVVPTWAAGSDLLRSVRYARQSSVHPPDQLAVVGYGAAGIAALSLALHQRRLGIGLARVTCVDGADGLDDPISGQPLAAPTPSPVSTEVDVVETADPAWARRTVETWSGVGWTAALIPSDEFTWRLATA